MRDHSTSLNHLGIRYSLSTLGGDLAGGAIAALVALPYGLAMANLMGLPPVLGLVTSIVTAPITALLGRNPVLIGGTASATVPFIARAVRAQGTGGAAKVCIVASVFMLMFSVLRFGRYIQKVPRAVVTGFSCGIGAMMFLSQLGMMLGVHAPIDRTSDNMILQSWRVLQHVGQAQPSALLLSFIVIAVAFLAASYSPKAPAPLLGVLAAVSLSAIFGIHQREVGHLPLSIPAFAGFWWRPSDVVNVVPEAFGLAFVASVNILITSRVLDHFRARHKSAKPADADTEIGAYGVANIIVGIFGAPMSVGIPARSLASVRSGGSTRMSNLFHGIFLLAFVVVGGNYISHIPMPALAGVTAYIGLALLEWSTWRRLPKMRRIDAVAFLFTAVAVLMMNAVIAVAAGSFLYLLRYGFLRWTRVRSQRERRRSTRWMLEESGTLSETTTVELHSRAASGGR